MFKNQTFAKLVEAEKPTGEVVSVQDLLVIIRGLEGASVSGVVLFENGGRGLIRAIRDTMVEVLTFTNEVAILGTLAVLENEVLEVGVGEALIGRVVNALGEPLDGKGAIATTARPKFLLRHRLSSSAKP